MLKSEQSLREEVVRVNRLVAEAGLIRSSDGNISVRLDEERLLITPSGIYKLAMQPEDLIVVDREGRALASARGLQPTSEILMHLEAYRQRPDIQAVLHAHPPYATAITIAGLPFPVDLLPEVLLGLGDVPTAPYATPGTLDLAASIREPIKTCDSVLLSHHGSISVGRTLEEALIALERLEHAAFTYYLARTLGAPIPLPAKEVALLREKGRNLRA